ncbi:MAG: PAS domain S-box protein [Rhodoferax sp.]|nr:PAS domain S-box protein [Rhodoferax sp.]
MKTLLFKPNSLRVQLTLALAGAVLFGALTPRLLAALWSTTDGSSPDLVSMLLAVTLFLTVALVLSRLLAQTLLAPLEALAQASEKITADTPEMAPVPVTTELLPMVQAINTLALTDARNTHEAAVAARTQALAASETRLNHVINASAEGFWDWDLSCNRVQINPRCGQLLGLEEGQLSYPSETLWIFVPVPDRDATQATIRSCLKTDLPCMREQQLNRPDGSVIWVKLHGSVVERNAAGRATRLVGSVIDITERHQAQAALHDRTEELRTILDLSPDGFVLFDHTRQVKYINPVFTRLTGFVSGAALGLDETAFWRVLSLRCLGNLSATSLTDASENIEPGNIDPGERRNRWLVDIALPQRRVLAITRLVSQTSQVAQILCFRDVTHETEVERLKSEFLSTAAHELRTPLASIYGFAELLLNQEFDDKSRREFLQIIYRQSHVMSLLINELLDLSRIEARHAKDFAPANTSALALVEEVVASFNRPPGRAAPVIRAPADDLLMHVDRNKARQALLNLLSNVYKYSPDGGEVHIAIDQVQTDDGMARVAIELCDQGIGMTPEQTSHVFERFYRANRTNKIPGTGLGMSIVKEIADLHNGSVSVDSTLGKGTCVSLTLPGARADDAQASSSQTLGN